MLRPADFHHRCIDHYVADSWLPWAAHCVGHAVCWQPSGCAAARAQGLVELQLLHVQLVPVACAHERFVSELPLLLLPLLLPPLLMLLQWCLWGLDRLHHS